MFCNRCLFFISPKDLRAPSADRRDTLPHDQYLVEFYNASPKIRGHSPKNLGAENKQFWFDFTQLPTLIANYVLKLSSLQQCVRAI